MTVPGMMAGQIIAGGNPIDAAKYQFLILAAIAALRFWPTVSLW